MPTELLTSVAKSRTAGARSIKHKRRPSFDWRVWRRPAAAYSQCPFWFWNDALDEAEIVRQIGEFQKRGVEAFVIHPRIGLPKTIGWLSAKLFRFMRVALSEARRRGMWVLLYDEGMYPSGSASGLVVERNPELQVRGLVCEEAGGTPTPHHGRDACATPGVRVRRIDGREVVIHDRPVDAVVRGLHYVGDENNHPGEEEPVAADLLNPDAVQCFIELVYERFYRELGTFFGSTVKGIFTDEPNPLSRLRETGVMPGTRGIVLWVSAWLGYDFTPRLPALWFDDEPEAERWRRDYRRAIAARMDETYYAPLSRWCEAHGIALTGHPAEPDEIGHLRHLHIPGQDIVWRQILPGTASALEGAPSTMAKAAASVKYHLRRERNLNEFAGAYGESLTFRELRWLASWLLIRGCDLLVPHAFYYSMRGPRCGERPPDVGPNSAWWNNGYAEWEALTRRLCWLNATFEPVCEVAILGRATELPWRAAKACFENRIDFHYVEPRDLADARVGDGGFLHMEPGRYSVVVAEAGYEREARAVPDGARVLWWDECEREHARGRGPGGAGELRRLARSVVDFDPPASGVRARRLRNAAGVEVVVLFNEGEAPVSRRVPIAGRRLDPATGAELPWTDVGNDRLELTPHGWAVFLVEARE
ncbi:hypothetical protein OpiT1DRAFT_03111 [Opitutaceae bacterium TAV1]|nr:hypothetical protein OpiT1DRAFT_03111 [Opitutaceae bacterium TAV1]